MKKQFKTLIFTLIFFTGISSFSQGLVIHGRVIDASTQKPIAEVEIINDFSKKGVTTDSEGQFSISIDEEKKGYLKLKHIGYFSESIPIKELINRKDFIFHLEQRIEELEEFNVYAIRDNNQPYRIEQIDRKQIEESQAHDIGSLLRAEPNVSGIKKGALGIDPVVRGLKYSQLNVQLQSGVKIEGGCPNRMDPATAHVDVNDLQNVMILKGPFGLKYGPNFGGVINLQTHDPKYYSKYETHVSALLGAQTNQEGFKTRLQVNGGGKDVAYNLQGNWKNYGDYKDGNGDIVNSSLTQYNLSGSIAVQPAIGHSIQLALDRNFGRNIDFPALPMDERSDDTYIFDLNYLGTDFGKSINFLRAKAYRSHVNHMMDNKNRPFSDTVVAVSEIEAINTGGRFGINLNAFKGQLEVGGDYEHIYKNGERTKNLIMQPGLPVKVEDLWNNAVIQNIGLFAEYQKKGKSLDWIFAGRADFNSATSDTLIRAKMNGDPVFQDGDTDSKFSNFSISAGLSWHISPSSELVFSLGSGTRSPDMTERFIILLPIGYDNYDYLGNPALEPETNNEIDLGYRYNSVKGGSLEFSGFFSYITNFITGKEIPPSEVKPQTKGVLGVKQFVNIDHAYLAGFEFSYQTPAKYNWLIAMNAAYTMGVNPVLEPTEPLPEIPPFESNIRFNYQFFNKRFIPELNLRLVAQQDRVSTTYMEQTTPGFTTLDFRLMYQFNRQLKVVAGVNNIFDAAYYEHLNRNIVGTTQPLYEMGRMFFMDLIFKL